MNTDGHRFGWGVLALLVLVGVAVADEAPYEEAITPRVWSFPRDHGKHDGFRTEWWYFTGNLTGEHGRELGYQLTLFRHGIAARATAGRTSPWATHEWYFGHLHVSDITERDYHFASTQSRARPGLAWAADDDLDVYVLGWSIKRDPATDEVLLDAKARSHDGMPMSLKLRCRLAKPIVFQGDGGLSKKGDAEGHASYYYSMTRLATAGEVRLGDERLTVTGLSWMDHEFSSNQLEPQQVGWDWFSLQFDDETEVMVYRLRNEEGGTDHAFATHVDPAGQPRYFDEDAITMQGSSAWTSPETGGAYPQAWRLTIDGLGAIDVTSRHPQQEMTTGVTYYEGSVTADFTRLGAAKSVPGKGYMELTGYAGKLEGF